MSSNSVIENIDESELSSENGELHLFQWLSSLEKQCTKSSSDDVKAMQASLEGTLMKIIAGASPYPPARRALRNLTSRCLVLLYSRGDSRTLFEMLQFLMKMAGDMKTSSDKEFIRITSFFCIGDLMFNFGSQVMSFMAEISAITLKTVKSSNSCLLRYHSLVALRKSIATAKRAITDAMYKDISKHSKVALGDKCLPVQRAAADLLLVVHDPPDMNTTIGEIESIVSICSRGLEAADQPTRYSFARLVGHLLASTQVDRSLPILDSPQQGKPDVNEDSSTKHVSLENKFSLRPDEMFTLLSAQFSRLHTSRRVRVGIFHFYAELIIKLGSTFVETNYGTIVGHLMTEIVSNPRNATTRYETLLVRRLVEIILRDLVGVRMLGEQAQIAAIQDLSRSYLKRWPSIMPGQVSPSPFVLVIILRETAGLLQQLGNTPPPVQDALAEPLTTLLTHPSHTIRINASKALQCFCYSTPLRLPKTIFTVMELLQRDINGLLAPGSSGDLQSRVLGYAYGLAALVSVVPERPLYVSYDSSAKVLDMAVQLLKRAGDHDVNIAEVEIEVAWTSVASLMSHGPIFVRPHLPQLLVLWRNALPKPTNKDLSVMPGRTTNDCSFLLHVRECALGAMLCFLQHNAPALVTLDTARRIASVLNNALVFVNSVSQIADEAIESQTLNRPEGPSLRIREDLLRRRIYQCFTALGFSSIAESTQKSLLRSAVSIFASPEGYAGSSVQAAIASSSGSFTSIWQIADCYAYGLTYIDVVNNEGRGLDDPNAWRQGNLHHDNISVAIDSLVRRPILGACEHDSLSVCDVAVARGCLRPEAPPAATSVVDSAIHLFAQLFVVQDLSSATRVIAQISESVRSTKSDKNSGRKAAVLINVAVALLLSLRCAATNQSRRAKEIFGNTQLVSPLTSLLKDILIDGDPTLRSVASESIGRLANLAGHTHLTNQIKLLVDQVVNNRDPSGRAGCALAFGAIHYHVGGLAAGPLLKTTVNILMSLSSDTHPLVHFSALNALAQVADAASLSYAPFVSSTLGMLLKVFLMESHEREGGVISNANLSGDHPAYPAICRVIDAVITISGPDLQESPRTRALLLNLVHELSMEEDEAVCVEALKCIQHLLMFTPKDIPIPELVDQFRAHISSPRRPLKLASINALYQLVQKDAISMSKLGGDQLVEDLFLILDDDPSVQGVRDVISSWLKQTVVHNPSAWIDLCQRIMSRTTATQRVADAIATRGNLHDDEGVSLARIEAGVANGHTTCRWRTQLFALQCLHNICIIVAQSGRIEHFDINYARKIGLATSGLLITRVSDLIKMSFTAATAYITEIRLEGLVVLQDIIEIFAKVPDPVCSDALLLEQYQAPITAALTPGISPESTPEILASAIKTSALFVGCGIVKDVNRMGRILKLLTNALQQSQEPGMLSLGETSQLGPNASAMLRISTLSAWAQLDIARSSQKHLSDVIIPLRSTLIPMWIAYLRDYAIIRANSEFLSDPSVMPESPQSSFGKEVLLPYYLNSWQFVLRAVAEALQSGDSLVFSAMHGRESASDDVLVQDGPAVFFFVIFGLAFEALSSSPPHSVLATSNHDATMVAALQALKCLINPKYSGNAMMETTTFEELISLCYRLAMTESATVQICLIDLLITLSLDKDQTEGQNANTALSSAQAHTLHICAFILRHTSTMLSKGAATSWKNQADVVHVIVLAFNAFRAVGESTTNPTIREDVRGVAILIYCEFLKDESSEIDLVTPTLQALKSLLELPALGEPGEERLRQLFHNLLSACLLNIEGMRGRQGDIANNKIRVNLLAAVLVLTAMPPAVRIGRKVIERACYFITETLLAKQDISLTAAQCAKALIITSPPRDSLCQCPKLLVPALIEYILKASVREKDKQSMEPELIVLEEVWKTLSALFASLTETHKTSLLGVVLPILALFLRHRSTSPQILHSQASDKLLFFASMSPASFKEASVRLDPVTREVLEQEIRQVVGPVTMHPTGQPQISLRSFSGS